jgi:uncharacterized protein YraI
MKYRGTRRGIGVVAPVLMCAVLMCLVSLWALASSAPAVHAAEEIAPIAQEDTGDAVPIYALPGRLLPAENQPFDTYLQTNDGKMYGIAGRTPEVETQIVTYRLRGRDFAVKVWGTLYPNGRTSNVPEILVEFIIPATPSLTPSPTATPTAQPTSTFAPTPAATPTRTPTPTPQNPIASAVNVNVNIRSGPGTDYPPIGVLSMGQSCPIIGRNGSATWWQIRCTNALTGWVSDSVVTVSGPRGNIPVVAIPPTPTPTNTPVPEVTGWQATYYANRNLEGSPVRSRGEARIDFNWGTGSPGSGIPADNFSARFERTMAFGGGDYEFRARVDDGVRVWIDNELIIDDWRERSRRTITANRRLYGVHSIRVEYFEASGQAELVLGINAVRGPNEWDARYFNNPNLAGSPVLIQSEYDSGYPLDRNSQELAVMRGVVPVNNFSVRWTGTFYFQGGNYTFRASAEGGVRVYVDDIRVINAWTTGPKEVSNTFLNLGAGEHTVRVEFFDRYGDARIRVWWDRRTGGAERDE